MPRSQPWPASATSAIGSAERGDAQVARRQVGDVARRRPARARAARPSADDHGGERDPRGEREPERLRAERRRRPRRGPAPCSRVDARGRAVGEEDAQRDEVRQHRRGERQRRELRRAEMADDRGVDQQVQRLGGQRAQGGQREAQDLAVVGGAAHAGPLYDPAHGPGPRAARRRVAGGLRRGRATPLDEAVREQRRAPSSARWPARPRPVTLPSGTRLSQCVVQRAQRRRPAERRAPSSPRAADHLSAAGRGGRRGRRAAARLPGRRGAARRAAHGGHPRRAAAPHRALGRGARRQAAPASPPRWPDGQRAGEAPPMRLRLYHHRDGARVAYREVGAGPPFWRLLHAGGCSPIGSGSRSFCASGRAPSRRHTRPAAARRLRGPPASPLHD